MRCCGNRVSCVFSCLISYVAPPGGGTTDYAVEIFYQALRYKHYRGFLGPETRLDMMYMPDATRAMIELLMLGRTHGYDALREAIEKTVAIGCMDVSAVVLFLNGGGGELRRDVEAVDIGGLSRFDRPQPTLTDYDQLLRKWPEEAVIQ